MQLRDLLPGRREAVYIPLGQQQQQRKNSNADPRSLPQEGRPVRRLLLTFLAFVVLIWVAIR